MALKGIKVIELSGLAPAPFCGMILSDFGASVIRVDKIDSEFTEMDCLSNGKKSLALNMRHPKGVDILKDLSKQSDILIEPFRKGVMERLNLGPDVLLKENPRLIYARLTGYGQSGPLSSVAGHDINFIAYSGILSLLGRKHENPFPPINLIADFGGGGLMCALGIILALYERTQSGLGQVVDNSMINGTSYLSSWLYRSQQLPVWGNSRGSNVLDSGAHFYEVYKTKDGKYITVGAIEPQFYQNVIEGLGLTNEEASQFGDFEKLKKLFAKKFLEKTRDEWVEIFKTRDACVAPVLDLHEAPQHPQNIEANNFIKTNDRFAPTPAPKLSRTPGDSRSVERMPKRGEHTREILMGLGFSEAEITDLEKNGVIEIFKKYSKL